MRHPHRRIPILLLLLVLIMAACGGGAAEDTGGGLAEEPAEEPAQEPTEPAAEAPEGTPAPAGESVESPTGASAAGAELEWVDGVLQPLEDGFPEETITLWCVHDAGHTDDLINQAIIEIASDMSPVPLINDCRPSAPHYQWAMIDFIPQQPRGDEPAYHPIMTSRYSLWEKAWTIPEFCGRDTEALEPINHLMWSPYVLFVPEDSELQTMEEAVEFYQQNPDANFATTQPGAGTNTAVQVWAAEAGLDNLSIVPTDGQSETRQLVLGGGAEMGLSSYGPGVLEGVRPLAVTGDQPFPPLPDVPHLGEFGWDVPGGSARGYVVLAGAEEARVEWLSALFQRAVEQPAWEERFGEEMSLQTEDAEYAKETITGYLESSLPLLEEEGLTGDCPIDENLPWQDA